MRPWMWITLSRRQTKNATHSASPENHSCEITNCINMPEKYPSKRFRAGSDWGQPHGISQLSVCKVGASSFSSLMGAVMLGRCFHGVKKAGQGAQGGVSAPGPGTDGSRWPDAILRTRDYLQEWSQGTRITVRSDGGELFA